MVRAHEFIEADMSDEQTNWTRLYVGGTEWEQIHDRLYELYNEILDRSDNFTKSAFEIGFDTKTIFKLGQKFKRYRDDYIRAGLPTDIQIYEIIAELYDYFWIH